MTDALKACPFCGGDVTITYNEPHEHPISGLPPFNGNWTVECDVCPSGMIHETEGDVIAIWNRRTPTEGQWMPIETAPKTLDRKKDGPQILVWDGESVGIVAWEIVNRDISIGQWRYQAGPNEAPFGDYNPSPVCENPTHWKQIPPPPGQGEG